MSLCVRLFSSLSGGQSGSRQRAARVTRIDKLREQARLQMGQLVVGIDYTKSNERRGLHGRQSDIGRPDIGRQSEATPAATSLYERVLDEAAAPLHALMPSTCVPAYGFGDATTRDRRVFPFLPDRDCVDVAELKDRYREITPALKFDGPTSFAPVILAASKHYRHETASGSSQTNPLVLLLATDGGPQSGAMSARALREVAARTENRFRLLVVGVGAGPFAESERLVAGAPAGAAVFIEYARLRRDIPNALEGALLSALIEMQAAVDAAVATAVATAIATAVAPAITAAGYDDDRSDDD